MAKISALESQKSDLDRVNVYLDGEFAFGVPWTVALELGLAVDRELSADDMAELRRRDALERAFSAALNLLSYRPRSRHELERYFRHKGTEAAVTQQVLERLERLGLADDLEFARYWVRNRQTFRPRGEHAVRAEMRSKGLDRDVIEAALEGAGDEVENAYAAGKKRLRSLEGLDDREFFRRMLGHLQRRGFGYPSAAAAAKRLAEERGMGDPDAELLPTPEP